MLGPVWPSFGPVYECLYNGFPNEAKPTGTVSLDKDQGTLWRARTLLGLSDCTLSSLL